MHSVQGRLNFGCFAVAIPVGDDLFELGRRHAGMRNYDDLRDGRFATGKRLSHRL